MAESARQQAGSTTAAGLRRGAIGPTDELVAFCPGCGAFETLWFTDDVLVPTRKFSQQGPRVFHDCGSAEPCRLLIRFLKQE